MPAYGFEHPETGDYVEIYMSIHDPHELFDSDGVQWRRIFTVPQMAVNSRIDPWSNRQFVEKTANIQGSVGSIMDLSGELSERRGGAKNDPVKRKYYKDWSKKRCGRKHPDLMDQ